MDAKRKLAEKRVYDRMGQELMRSQPDYYNKLAAQLQGSGQAVTPEAIARARASMFSAPDERTQAMIAAEMESSSEPMSDMKALADRKEAARVTGLPDQRFMMQEPSAERIQQMQQEKAAKQAAELEAAQASSVEDQYAQAGMSREAVARGERLKRALQEGGDIINPYQAIQREFKRGLK
jgi:hypothetical protein